jgi:leucyl aminopeptidase
MIKIDYRPLSEGEGDTCIYFVRQRTKQAPACPDKTVADYLKNAWDLGDFRGQTGKSLIFYQRKAQEGKTAERIIVVGLGKEKPSLELFREAGGVAVSAAMTGRALHLRVCLPEQFGGISRADLARALVEGLVLGSYRFDKYRRNPEPEDNSEGIKTIVIHPGEDRTLAGAIKRGQVTATAVNAARDMANEPGNHWTPGHFVKAGWELAGKYDLSCKVFDKAALKKLGMGGIVGVGQGSVQPPAMVVLEYRGGTSKSPTLLLVGKGLTFDSGGISLKPGAGMQDMKFDMCGGAAVFAVMQALGQLKPPGVNIIGLVPTAENMGGSAALKPGDIITQFNGKNVEVVNTDAEGRLILADALAYGVKHYQPTAVIDIATLTGAVIIGLGHHRTGLLGNNDALAGKLLASGERCGEPLWRLPMGKEYRQQLKSEVADLKNVGSDRAAGTITAACFLEEFVGKTAWAHLDIAGTAWDFTKKSYIPKGPSGVGVRTMLELILNWK